MVRNERPTDCVLGDATYTGAVTAKSTASFGSGTVAIATDTLTSGTRTRGLAEGTVAAAGDLTVNIGTGVATGTTVINIGDVTTDVTVNASSIDTSAVGTITGLASESQMVALGHEIYFTNASTINNMHSGIFTDGGGETGHASFALPNEATLGSSSSIVLGFFVDTAVGSSKDIDFRVTIRTGQTSADAETVQNLNLTRTIASPATSVLYLTDEGSFTRTVEGDSHYQLYFYCTAGTTYANNIHVVMATVYTQIS